MCPSYRATGDEQHSTRGRARLLWEMLAGDLRQEGFQSEAVHEALDLCLSCKACKTECPVQVDMAAYKAEFLAQHYKGRLHPLSSLRLWLCRQAGALGITRAGAHQRHPDRSPHQPADQTHRRRGATTRAAPAGAASYIGSGANTRRNGVDAACIAKPSGRAAQSARTAGGALVARYVEQLLPSADARCGGDRC